MSIDKSLLSGSTTTLILKLLTEKDMYGYEMIAVLSERSDNTFVYAHYQIFPHRTQPNYFFPNYEVEDTKCQPSAQKYYHITVKGKALLEDKFKEWQVYCNAVNAVLNGGVSYGNC